MKVIELIEKLKSFDENIEVAVDCRDYGESSDEIDFDLIVGVIHIKGEEVLLL